MPKVQPPTPPTRGPALGAEKTQLATTKTTPLTELAARITPPGRTVKNGVVVTYSELDAFRQCPLKHWLAYKHQYSKQPDPMSPLSLGTLWHEVMEVHYRLLATLTPKQRRNLEAVNSIGRRVYLMKINPIEDADEHNLIDWMYRGHLDRYGGDPDWDIIAVERPGQVRIRDERGRLTRFYYRFKMDLLVRDRTNGRVYLVDHKTVHDFTRQAEIDIDDQFGLYTAALRQMGIPVFAVIKSEARKRQLKGDQDGSNPSSLDRRFVRTVTYRSDAEVANTWDDARKTARVAYSAAYPADRMPHSNPAPDRCVWRCDFREVHIAARKGMGLTQVLGDYGFSRSPEKHREYSRSDLEGVD